ncbi:MAG: hypothetical protein BWY68_00073 [bacterium ADurb.Bin400]|nr:MAG: hypothetical protein BWY68_00073 [bacterium ADurb.Bin400]
MRFDPIPIGIGIVTTAVLILLLVFAGGRDAELGAYESNAPIQNDGEPKIEIEDTRFSLYPNVVIKQKDVAIGNIGSGTLVLSDFSTSCPCLSAQLYKAGPVSPLFSGNSNKRWQGSLSQSEESILRITFDSKTFDWTNPTSQKVTFKTNDPERPEVKIEFNKTASGVTDYDDNSVYDYNGFQPESAPQ